MLLAGFAQSCGDNTDFSLAHVLTDDELAELARQDSIRQEMLKYIDADSVFYYEVTDYLSTQWTFKSLYIDMEGIGEVLGLTADQVADGIIGIDGAPDITKFCINGSTHADNKGSQTAAGAWGHWFDTNADAGTWDDLISLGTIAFYVEWQGYADEDTGARDPEYDFFNIGQFPDKFTTPQEWTAYECLQYQDKRVCVAVNYKLIERGAIEGGIVGTQYLEVTLPENPNSYDPTAVEFDLDAVLSALGLSEIDPDNDLTAYKEDGSFANEQNADRGFWFDKNGYVGSWGDDASAWISYGMIFEDEESETIVPNVIGVCLMPGATSAGDVYVHDFGFINGSSIYMLNITINVVEAEKIGEVTIVNRQDLVANIAPDDVGLYVATPVAFDLAQVLADLGLDEIDPSTNITAYDANGDLMTYLNADNGFWYDKNGYVGSWGDDASVWISYGITDDPSTIGVCPMPSATAIGEVYEHDFYFINDLLVEQLHITVNITEYEDPEDKPGTNPADATQDVAIDIEWTEEWPDAYVDVRDLVRNAFNLTTHEVFEALNNDDLKVYLNEVGDGVPSYNANHGEYWIDLNGDMSTVAWDQSPFYSGFYTDGTSYIEVGGGINSNIFPNADTTVNYTLILLYQGTKVTFNMSLNVTAGEEVEKPDFNAGTVAYTATLECSFPESDLWSEDVVEFDLDAVKSALSISSTTELYIIGEVDGAYTDKFSANAGFWYDNTATIIPTFDADVAAVYIEYWGNDAENLAECPEDANLFYYGYYPGSVHAGDVITAQIGLYANGKIALFDVKMTVTEPVAAQAPAKRTAARHAAPKNVKPAAKKATLSPYAHNGRI